MSDAKNLDPLKKVHRFRQHKFNECDQDDAIAFDYATTEELLRHPILQVRRQDPNFSRYSVAADSTGIYLMAEYADGKYYVVGHLDCVPAGLPKWAARPK
jgi:hypothetical protein